MKVRYRNDENELHLSTLSFEIDFEAQFYEWTKKKKYTIVFIVAFSCFTLWAYKIWFQNSNPNEDVK